MLPCTIYTIFKQKSKYLSMLLNRKNTPVVAFTRKTNPQGKKELYTYVWSTFKNEKGN